MKLLGLFAAASLTALVGGALSSGSAQDEPDLNEVFQDLIELQAHGLAERSDRWVCPLTRKYGCGADECKSGEPTIVIELSFSGRSGVYRRCDAKGCDAYEINPQKSGIYTAITIAPGAFFKATNDGSEFIEAVTAGTSTLIGFGRCLPQ